MKRPSPRILELIIILVVWAIIVSSLSAHYIYVVHNENGNPGNNENNPYNNTNEGNTPFNGHLNITNVQVESDNYNLILIVDFDRVPDFTVYIDFQNRSETIATDYMDEYNANNMDRIVIYDSINLNGTYWVVAYYNESYIFDKYWLNFTPKAKMISHYEDETYYDWENQTEVNPIYVTVKNIGDTPIFIENYNCTVRYTSNNTLAGSDDGSLLTTTIGKNESENITIYPYFYLEPNQTYIMKIVFWGENSDVKFEFAYQIKT